MMPIKVIIDNYSLKDIIVNSYDISESFDCEFILRSFNDHYLIQTKNDRYILIEK